MSEHQDTDIEATGLHRCPGCGLELDADDPHMLCGDCIWEPHIPVPLATRLADPGDYVREQLIEGDFGDPWDMPLWQREHLARVIEHYRIPPVQHQGGAS